MPGARYSFKAIKLVVQMVDVILPDGTRVSAIKSNANVIADKDNYSGKRKGEIIFDASEGKYYGNHAEDGATPDWQELGMDVSNGLDMLSNKITNVATPTTDNDAATKKYVDDQASASSTLSGDATGDINMKGHVLKDSTGALVLESVDGIFTFRKSA